MMLASLLLSVTLSAPSLSRSDLERLANAYLATHLPTVTMLFHGTVADAGEAALARAGLAKTIAKWRARCGGFVYSYAPSKTLLEIAERRDWRIKGRADAGPLAITIPVGRYAYIVNSVLILDSTPSFKWIDFNYRLVESTNAKTLAFLAPPADWFLDSDTLNQNAQTLADVLRPQVATFGVERSHGRWVLLQRTNVHPYVVGGSTCAVTQ